GDGVGAELIGGTVERRSAERIVHRGVEALLLSGASAELEAARAARSKSAPGASRSESAAVAAAATPARTPEPAGTPAAAAPPPVAAEAGAEVAGGGIEFAAADRAETVVH